MKLPSWVSKMIGKIYIVKTPFYMIYNPHMHRLKGYEIRTLINNLKAGDIILRSYNGYLNSYLTPGFWSHAGLVISNEKVIHAIGKGVIEEDILDFCRADSCAILRFKNQNEDSINKAITIAKKMVQDRVGYDFAFEDENKKVYCTELVNECYDGVFYNCYQKIAGNDILLPDPLKKSELLNTIVEFKH